MKRTFAKIFIISGLFIISCTNKEVVSPQKPNIIFIITDDQQTGLLGIEGHSVIKTPNIDRIGEEGVLFQNFFVTTPLCSPSRASFLTGRYPHSHLVINNDKVGLDVISHTLMTWPRQLREAGYETAFIGKWHMGLDDSRRPGFDRWLSFKGQGIYIDGVVNDDGLQRQITGYMTDYLNDQAVDFVNREHHGKPFAMVFSHKAVHWPILPAEEYSSQYSDYNYETQPDKEEDVKGKPFLTKQFPRVDKITLEGVVPEPAEPRRNRGNDLSNIVRDQMRCLSSVDDGIGRLFTALEKNGQLDNTIIIYTSDNGMLMGQHGEFNQKRWAYDPAIRVPLLMRFPSTVDAGSICEKIVLNVDIAPTILDIAGVRPIVPMHGQSFLPLLKNEDAPWRKAFLAEYFLEKVVPKVPSWKAVRTEDWKYIQFSEDNDSLNELYNLKADPDEEHNLIADPNAQEQVCIMKKQLTDLYNNSK